MGSSKLWSVCLQLVFSSAMHKLAIARGFAVAGKHLEEGKRLAATVFVEEILAR